MLIAQERASLVIANNMREARIEIKSVAERDDFIANVNFRITTA